MGEFLAYSIVSGILMLALYLAYRVFLSSHNQHAFNRVVLLLIYVLSFVAAPLILASSSFKGHSISHSEAIAGISVISRNVTPDSKPMIWGTILIWIFSAGMVIVAIKTIIIWIRLLDVIRAGKKIRQNGYTIVLTDNERLAPFSWINYVVTSLKDYENNCTAIATHELKHITSHHWIDLLIAQAVCVVNWFNPAAWLMRDELMLVHEYQADMAVIKRGYDVQDYQNLLVKKAVGSRFPSLANSLNHSKLKKRITMMYKEKSSAGQKFKALALMPTLALAVGLVTVPSVRAAVSAISSSNVSVSKDNENLSENKNDGPRYRVAKLTNDGEQTTVVIAGENLGNNLTVSGGTLNVNGSSIQANSLKSEMTDGIAEITATFPCIYKDAKATMSLKFNGEEIAFDLAASTGSITYHTQHNHSSKIGIGKEIVINLSDSAQTNDIEFFLDGKKIRHTDMKSLDPKMIQDMRIEGDSIIITTKATEE